MTGLAARECRTIGAARVTGTGWTSGHNWTAGNRGTAGQSDGQPCTTSNGIAGTTVLYSVKGHLGPSIGCAVGATTGKLLDLGETVFDTRTGLLWEKKTGTIGASTACSATSPHDVNAVCTWSGGLELNADGSAFTQFLEGLNTPARPTCTAGFDGITRCPKANAHGCLAGHFDWRLPETYELLSIGDVNVAGCAAGSTPCIASVFLPSAEVYWSADSAGQAFDPNVQVSWVVSFSGGGKGDFVSGDDSRSVRALRGGR